MHPILVRKVTWMFVLQKEGKGDCSEKSFNLGDTVILLNQQ